MVWYGMVWYGMVWYGMVWYGMVWYGMTRKSFKVPFSLSKSTPGFPWIGSRFHIILTLQRTRKIRCLERDSKWHLRVSRILDRRSNEVRPRQRIHSMIDNNIFSWF
jgi:hypothetical protein